MALENLFIEEEQTIIEAMQRLDQVARKILFIQKDGKLAAALTDGDIRRWILAGKSLNSPVKEAANYKPLFLYESERDRAKQLMKEKSIEAVPIVDADKKIVNIVFWNDKEIAIEHASIDVPVVVMAGGLGTRLYPYTKILPKPLIPVADVPIAEHIINRFRQFGCQDFYLVVNYKKNMIKAYFNELERDYAITYVDEDIPLGTGGGVGLLKGKINSTFILTNCDILINEDFAKIYAFHQEKQNKITMICSLQNFTIPYGVVEIEKDGSIGELKEKPTMSFFTNTGCYIVEPEVIDEVPAGVSIGFPEIIENCKAKGEKVGVYPIGEKAWMDMGQMDTLEEMRMRLEK